MLIDLLDPANQVTYNNQLAHIIGLEPAIYINTLFSINSKARKKLKLCGEMMVLDRDYIFNRTTISPKRQIEIEVKLNKIGLIIRHESDPNQCRIDSEVLTDLMMGEDAALLKSAKKLAKIKGASKVATDEIKTAKAKSFITVENPELRNAYCDWIEAIVGKFGWLSNKAVTVAQQIVDDFANHDLDIALEVIEIAAINSYKDMNWAVVAYRNKHGNRYQVNPAQLNLDKAAIALGDDVF